MSTFTPAISIESLGKRYLVDHEAQRGGYRTLRESLMDMAAAPFRRLRGVRSSTREEFWALKDVSFEVQPGEVVGIIGRNGAGKSTLLKILSQITKPTTGRVRLNGRVGSLLEVGTGFHPELTGRENIYLNGSILGMTRQEIAKKFDEIVDFAEIEKFLDTPVKRYSSGMYVRLAFAVAAHLEPEILIVDEVLAVGDQAFQEKCLGKMQQVTHSGRTVFFVSHNLQMLHRLCNSIAWLECGQLRSIGTASSTLEQFARSISTAANSGVVELSDRRVAKGNPIIQRVILQNSDGMTTSTIKLGESITLMADFENYKFGSDANAVFQVSDAYGSLLFTCSSALHSQVSLQGLSAPRLCCNIPEVNLVPGQYSVSVAIGTSEDYLDRAERALLFEVQIADIYGTGIVPDKRSGIIAIPHFWKVLVP